MPYEILVSIFSLLPMEEAIRTSVLARRWHYLWTFTTRLEFDDVSIVNLLNAQPSIPIFFDLSQFVPTYPHFLFKGGDLLIG